MKIKLPDMITYILVLSEPQILQKKERLVYFHLFHSLYGKNKPVAQEKYNYVLVLGSNNFSKKSS